MDKEYWRTFLKKTDTNVVREYLLNKRLDYDDEKVIQSKVLEIGEKLGEKGRCILKRSELPGKISIFIESKDFDDCKKYILEFETFLKNQGYL